MTRTDHLLTKAMEECNEVAHRLSKALRFGMSEVQPGQPLTNAERVRQEFNDLVVVLGMVEEATGEILTSIDYQSTLVRRAKVETFLEFSRKLGRLA